MYGFGTYVHLHYAPANGGRPRAGNECADPVQRLGAASLQQTSKDTGVVALSRYGGGGMPASSFRGLEGNGIDNASRSLRLNICTVHLCLQLDNLPVLQV